MRSRLQVCVIFYAAHAAGASELVRIDGIGSRLLQTCRPGVPGPDSHALGSAGDGRVNASDDDFVITVRGKLAHSALKGEGRRRDRGCRGMRDGSPDDPQPQNGSHAADVPGHRHHPGGTAVNILADRVKLAGTLRALDPGLRDSAKRQMRGVLAGITAAHGATFDLAFTASIPMNLNDRTLLEASIPSLQKTASSAL
jgi:metal-dependent amidase/aminoacylase/carboxypeptidase family protein